MAQSDHLQAAYCVFERVIVAESAARGVVLSDVWSDSAPWRKDDALLAPWQWERAQKYPQLVDALLSCQDADGASERFLSLGRYIAVMDLGTGSHGLFQRFTRVVRRQPNFRVRRKRSHKKRKKRWDNNALTGQLD
jgi:hypothetical protein